MYNNPVGADGKKTFTILSSVEVWGGSISIVKDGKGTEQKFRNAMATIVTTKIGQQLMKLAMARKSSIPIIIRMNNTDAYGAGADFVTIDPNGKPKANTAAGEQRYPLDVILAHELAHILGSSRDDSRDSDCDDSMAHVRKYENPYRSQRRRQLRAAGKPKWLLDLYAERLFYGNRPK